MARGINLSNILFIDNSVSLNGTGNQKAAFRLFFFFVVGTGRKNKKRSRNGENENPLHYECDLVKMMNNRKNN
jgi:hypothetical protein